MNEVKSRFGGPEMVYNPEAPRPFVEIDEKTGHDRFGNRFMSSSQFAYEDREKEQHKAGLLISEQGERFIKENPGILKDIDSLLLDIAPTKSNNFKKDKERVERNGRSVQFIGEGQQSFVFKLEIQDHPYIIKVLKSYGQFHQPYINEMLQTQSLSTDREEEFDEIGIEFPEFLFASGKLLCMEYVPQETQYDKDFVGKFYAASVVTDDYIEAQHQSQNKLWDHAYLDKVHRGGIMPISNFRRREDNSLVWVDTVAYFPNEGKPYDGSDHYPVLNKKEISELEPLSVTDMQTEYLAAVRDLKPINDTVKTVADDEVWVTSVHDMLREYGVEPNPDIDFLSVDINKAKKQVLKKHNVRWAIDDK